MKRPIVALVAVILPLLAIASTADAAIICSECQKTGQQVVVDRNPPFPHCPDWVSREDALYDIYEEECYDSATGQYFDRFCYRDLVTYACVL